MTILSKPSGELAKRILTEVEFDDRIEGFRLRERAGIMPTTMYSFAEVVGFLSDEFPRMDFDELALWLREVIKDHELSEKIRDEIQSEISDQEKAPRIRDLMGIRLVQSKKKA
jgi:hypothetical protein